MEDSGPEHGESMVRTGRSGKAAERDMDCCSRVFAAELRSLVGRGNPCSASVHDQLRDCDLVTISPRLAQMLDFELARQRILAEVKPLAGELIPVDDADGRVLSEDLRASLDLPPFDYSAMDGYAVRAADFSGADRGSYGFRRSNARVAVDELWPRARRRASLPARRCWTAPTA